MWFVAGNTLFRQGLKNSSELSAIIHNLYLHEQSQCTWILFLILGLVLPVVLLVDFHVKTIARSIVTAVENFTVLVYW